MIIIAVFPGVGRKFAEKALQEKGFSVISLDSSTIDPKYDGWEAEYAECIQAVADEAQYDVLFVSLNHNTIRLLVEKGLSFSMVAPDSQDPRVKEMMLGRFLLMDQKLEHTRWLKRMIRRYDDVVDNEKLRELDPDATLYLIDLEHPYLTDTGALDKI